MITENQIKELEQKLYDTVTNASVKAEYAKKLCHLTWELYNELYHPNFMYSGTRIARMALLERDQVIDKQTNELLSLRKHIRTIKEQLKAGGIDFTFPDLEQVN